MIALAESVGFHCSHWVRSFEKFSPAMMIGFVAPVARMVLTTDCVPTTVHEPVPPVTVHPPFK